MNLPVAKCACSVFGTRGGGGGLSDVIGPDCIPVWDSNVLSHSHDEYDVFLKIESRLVNRNLCGLSYQYVFSYLFYYHYYYHYCYYLIIYLFFTAHPAIFVLRPIPSWTTSIFIGQTIPSFAVDTHPLLPMRTIFVTCLLGLLKIACFLRVKLQVFDPVQLCQLR